jgi:ATP-dependent DNA ligase
LRFSEHCETEGEAYYRKACKRGWGGIIAKNGDSVYVSRRTRDWLKFKCQQEQEFVIGGYTDPRGDRFRSIAVGVLPQGKAHLCGQGRNRVRQ